MVSDRFRYLGATVNTTSKRMRTLIASRFQKATAMARKLAKLNITSRAKLKAVQSKKDDDRGTYWCVASNPDGEAVSRKAQLDIASKWPDSICNQSL